MTNPSGTVKIHRGWLSVAVVSIGLLIFLVAVAGWKWAGSDKLDLAQWLPAVTGVATLMAAIVAAVYANSAFKLEAAREDRWTETQRTAQASRVAVWIGTAEKPAPFDRTRTAYGFSIRNASDVPVTQVYVRLYRAEHGAGLLQVGVLPPGSEATWIEFPENSMSFRTSYAERHPSKTHPPRYLQFRSLWEDGLDVQGGHELAEISFMDSAGRAWHRDHRGALKSGHADWVSWVRPARLDEWHPPI